MFRILARLPVPGPPLAVDWPVVLSHTPCRRSPPRPWTACQGERALVGLSVRNRLLIGPSACGAVPLASVRGVSRGGAVLWEAAFVGGQAGFNFDNFFGLILSLSFLF